MKELMELNKIVSEQKTVRTARLGKLVDGVQKAYSNTARKIANQKETIKKLNKEYSIANSKAARLSVHVQNHEDLKKAQQELRAENVRLQEENRELKKRIKFMARR